MFFYGRGEADGKTSFLVRKSEREVGLRRTFGDDSKEVTPVPIPNTVVKLLYADDTWWVTARESK